MVQTVKKAWHTLSAFNGPLAAAACMYREVTTFGAVTTDHKLLSCKIQQITTSAHKPTDM